MGHGCPGALRSQRCHLRQGQVLWVSFSYKVRLSGGILKMSHLCAEQTQPEGRAGLVLTPSDPQNSSSPPGVRHQRQSWRLESHYNAPPLPVCCAKQQTHVRLLPSCFPHPQILAQPLSVVSPVSSSLPSTIRPAQLPPLGVNGNRRWAAETPVNRAQLLGGEGQRTKMRTSLYEAPAPGWKLLLDAPFLPLKVSSPLSLFAFCCFRGFLLL